MVGCSSPIGDGRRIAQAAQCFWRCNSSTARGFAHAGVIKVLEAHGLRPDLIVGSSAGSIVGALYASGLTAAELEGALGRLDAKAFSDLTVPTR